MCILDGCNYKEKYGEYCYKHRRNYLIDSSKHPSKTIIVNRWTNKCSDYLKKDILDNLCDKCYLNEHKYDDIILSNKNKQELIVLSIDRDRTVTEITTILIKCIKNRSYILWIMFLFCSY